jgi:3-oxoacyl-[acyl-carrier-protein] synthase II
MVGESAGFAVLVSEGFLDKHSLTPKAEFLGFGNTLDAYKITAPDPKGDSITRAIQGALKMSGLENEKIDYINAHGTGTRQNDELELNCIKRALGDQWNSVPISSTKDRHGHAIAAAGIQEFCITLEMMKNSILPSNLNLKNPCNEDFNLIRKNESSPIKHALTNNFAFGGINTVLALKNMNQ